MKSINTKAVRVPITQSSPDKTSTKSKLHGSGDRAIIFSNMDTNDQHEWDSIINELISARYMGITYTYPAPTDDQSGILEDVISFVCDLGAKKIVLIGASRGGVASITVAARYVNSENIVGIVAISSPIEHEGTIFYSDGELKGIRIPRSRLRLFDAEYDGVDKCFF